MRVALNTFARSGLEARLGPDLAAGVRAALRYYARCLDLGRKLPAYPRFRRKLPPEAVDNDLELQVDAAVERALEREVARQGAPLEHVAAHAVLIYLAHLDSLGTGSEIAQSQQGHSALGI